MDFLVNWTVDNAASRYWMGKNNKRQRDTRWQVNERKCASTTSKTNQNEERKAHRAEKKKESQCRLQIGLAAVRCTATHLPIWMDMSNTSSRQVALSALAHSTCLAFPPDSYRPDSVRDEQTSTLNACLLWSSRTFEIHPPLPILNLLHPGTCSFCVECESGVQCLDCIEL